MQGGTSMQKVMVAGGRPAYAVLLFAAFHTLGAIDNLGYLRLIGVSEGQAVGGLVTRIMLPMVQIGHVLGPDRQLNQMDEFAHAAPPCEGSQ